MKDEQPAAASDVDVLIVGAGLSGIGSAWHLQTHCPDRRYAIIEARDAIGGTWDLFRYPGNRSDSDMYTLGYSFEPWTECKSIADGPSILAYLNRVADKYGIRRHIRFGHKLVAASFDSRIARWTVEIEAGGERRQMTARWLHMATGFYDYDEAHFPDFPGWDSFGGDLFHAQFWPEQLDLRGRRAVVIGSGATAVTIVPELARTGAAHVTMLQRSPSYVVSLPAVDKFANKLRRLLGPRRSHALIRWRNVLMQQLFFRLARRWPEWIKKVIRKGLLKELPPGYPIEPHFSPRYNPWDQRLCLVPDADLFAAIREGKVEVVTDTIARIVPDGIELKSGRLLETDLIVAATGLKIKLLGDVALTIDGKAIPLAGRMTYKGLMFDGVPNFSYSFGYTNASWTLKADLTSFYLCRLLNHMRATGKVIAAPVRGAEVSERPFLDFSSNYIQRARHILPVQGDRAPWMMHQSYARDIRAFKYGKLEDGVLQFGGTSYCPPAAAGGA